MMKKLVVAVFSALLLMTVLISCSAKGGSATPGNLTPATANPTPHASTGEKDVSSEYFRKLCSVYWLDTSSMECCKLNDDGTYVWYRSKNDATQSASGVWRLTEDDQGFLSMYMTDGASGNKQVLHEIELYEESIYAVDDEGNSIVWLTTTRKES